MKFTLSLLRSLLIVIVALVATEGSYALDIVTLKSEKVLYGKILEKGDDGSFLMHLTNGTKRYVLSDEVESLIHDDTPFIINNESEAVRAPKAKRPPVEPCKMPFTLYLGYENLAFSDVSIEIKSFDLLGKSPGVVVGFGYCQPIKYGIIFSTGLEFSYNSERLNRQFLSEVKENEDWDGDHDADWLDVRLPLLIGYQYHFNEKNNIQIQTGPIIESAIFQVVPHTKVHWSDFQRYLNTYQTTYIDAKRERYFQYRRFNADWRFGLNLNINHFYLGFTYNLGLSNRLSECYDYYERNSYTKQGYHSLDESRTVAEKRLNAKLKRNYFQIRLGVRF